MQLAENTVVAGRYRLIGLIGRGGMGSVWRATHLGLDIPCAVKFIEGEMAALPEAQARFEREAKAAAQLRSPHVVQIIDHGICEGTPYIAMELLEGEDLGKRLSRMRTLSPQELHHIINQVCRALGRAHALGIVHRDLKPDNIFLTLDDEGREIAKVLDFGIAKNTSATLGDSNTKTGAMLGTPYYMSPEQAQGTKTIDSRSDLWSLAIICFQALTGKLPFESEALGDLLVKIIVAPIPLPSQFGAVPPGFDRWWQRAASREASERYQTAKEFSDQLAIVCGVSQVSGVVDRPHLRVAAHTTPEAAPPTLPQAPGGPPPPGFFGATPPPTQALGPPGVTTGAPMARTYTDDAAAGVPRKGPLVAIAAGVATLLVLGIVGVLLFVRSGSKTAAAAGPDPTPSAVASAAASAPGSPPPSPSPAVSDSVAAVPPAPPPTSAPIASAAPSIAATPPPPAPKAPRNPPAGASKGGKKQSGSGDSLGF